MTSTTMASDLAREALEPGTRWKHKNRGSTYELVGKAQVQAEADRPLTDYEIVTVYRCEADGELWARRVSEFLDGRFEPLPRTAYDAIGSGVKALEWGARAEGNTNSQGRWFEQSGYYRIVKNGDAPHSLFHCVGGWLGEFSDLNEAKAAAQADFERRVLSCLSTRDAEIDHE